MRFGGSSSFAANRRASERERGVFCISFFVSPLRCFVYAVSAIAIVFLLLVSPLSPLSVFSAGQVSQPSPTTQHEATPHPTRFPPTASSTSVPLQTQTTALRGGRDDAALSVGVHPKLKPRVAIAITVTKDGPFVDGALVLGFAAKKFHSARYGFASGYDVDLVAFVTPSVKRTRDVLSQFGWRVLERPLPVALDEIENKQYMQAMKDSGCCGADEFLKLWAYTLTEYHRVLHLDMDSIVFANLDEVLNEPYELLYTGDYNMKAGSPVAPAQGGFLLIRPSVERFEEFRAVIRKGDHGPAGWGGSHIGNFWGGQTIQGIVPYFYHVLHHGDAKELNRCVYNQMVDNPYRRDTTRCLDGQPTCEDCRLSDIETVKSAHFTICQKPWTCTAHTNPKNKKLCLAFHKKWFELRDEYEVALGIDPSYRPERSVFAESRHMCKAYGDDKYFPLPIDRVTKQPEF